MRRLQSITNKLAPILAIAAVLLIWLSVTESGVMPAYMLPSPVDVCSALVKDFSTLMEHAAVTLTEAFAGLGIGILLSFVIATLMDRFNFLYKAFYPLMVITQTIPTVAIAPLLVLWMGFGMAPKITLVVITTFFSWWVNAPWAS